MYGVGPGPWAGGYQFPDGTGVAPPPPADPAAPVMGGGQLPGGTTANPPPAPMEPTLGDVATTGGTAPDAAPSDYRAIFEKNLALTSAVHGPSLRQPLPEANKPGLLANILTFGMAGLADRDYRVGYNAAVERDNAKIRTQAVDDAVKLTNYSAVADRANLGLNMQYLRLLEQKQQNAIGNLYRELGLDINRQRLGLQQGRAGVAGSVPPPTPEQAADIDKAGMEWVPDPPGTVGSRGGHILPKNRGGDLGGGGGGGGVGGGGGGGEPAPGGTTYNPPTRESPLGGLSTGGGGAGAGTGAGGGAGAGAGAGAGPWAGGYQFPSAAGGAGGAPGGPKSPVLTREQLKEREATQKGRIELEKQRQTTLEEVRRNADSVREWFNSPDFEAAVTNALPSGGKNPLIATGAALVNKPVFAAKEATGNPHVAYLQRAESNIIETIRALSAGSKGLRINIPEIEIFGKPLLRLAEGRMTQAQARTFKTVMLNRLDQVQRALEGQAGTPGTEGGAGAGAPPPPPAGNTRTLSSGKTITVEP